jgi:hypothetical protein
LFHSGPGRFSGENSIVSYIVLDETQAKIIAQAKGNVEIRDSSGRHLGYLTHGFTDQDIRIALERAASNAPRYSTVEMLNQLAALGP